jgi:regulator of PEP synthase PpsR (kinase-PPPase family)
MKKRQVFFVSDGTGITAEALGTALLTQFNEFEFKLAELRFINTEAKAREAAAIINQAAQKGGSPPLVFSTLTEPPIQQIIAATEAHVFDFFAAFIDKLEVALNSHSIHQPGRMHGIKDIILYERRVGALNFTLAHDDGMIKDLDKADVILIGVSRCGKTPTCLYLSMHFRLRAANYPLTDDDLDEADVPPKLRKYRDRLFGLTINPEQLNRIREERRPRSKYASLKQCRSEVARAESIFKANSIPYLDTSAISIEEIAANIVQHLDLRRPPRLTSRNPNFG